MIYPHLQTTMIESKLDTVQSIILKAEIIRYFSLKIIDMIALLIKCDTWKELAERIAQAGKEFEEENIYKSFTSVDGNVPGKVFEDIMHSKGYKVSSIRAKKARCLKSRIRMTKHGNQWWYKLEDIERVPRKR